MEWILISTNKIWEKLTSWLYEERALKIKVGTWLYIAEVTRPKASDFSLKSRLPVNTSNMPPLIIKTMRENF